MNAKDVLFLLSSLPRPLAPGEIPSDHRKLVAGVCWVMPDSSGVLDMWGDGARGARRQLVCAKAGIMHVKIAS
jgi:hypothetical protein